MEILIDNWELAGLAVLTCVSELIGLNPKWKSNSIVQIILKGFFAALKKKR